MGVTAASYARMLSELLPPGRLWNLVSSTLQNVLLAGADELERVDGRAADIIEESDPSTATELLPEYERELDLEEAATDAERRARVIARLVARQRFRPVDFQQALAVLLGQDPADVDVIENSRAFAILVGDAREIFKFYVYRNPALPGTYFLDSAQAIVDAMKPSHTQGFVIESVSFLCDDPFSLCDRDLLGA